MTIVEVPLSQGSAKSQSPTLTNSELINWYINVPENGGFTNLNLFSVQGKKLIINTGSTEVNRGGHVMNDIPYFVNDTNLYRLNRAIDTAQTETFAVTNLGTITGSGRVSMADNGTQLMIVVPGGTAFVYNHSTDVFAPVTDTTFTTALGPSNSVRYIDGFFVHTSSKTPQDTIFHSNLLDGLTYDALDFGSAEVDPDKIISGHVHNNKFYALGSETIQVYDNVGGSGFVLANREGFVIPKGLLARFTPIEYDGGFVFLGAGVNEQPAVWKLSGSQLERLSTTDVQDQLAKFTDTEISNAFCWVGGTHGAYFLRLTVGNKTFAYDSTASALLKKRIWHNETSFVEEAVLRNRVNSAVTAYGRVLVGDAVSGRIGELDTDTFDEYGNEILRSGVVQSLNDKNEPINIGTIEINVESGVGNSDIADPQLELAIAYDGDPVFTPRGSNSMGKVGEFHKRLLWPMNGMINTQGLIKYFTSAKAKANIMKITMDID